MALVAVLTISAVAAWAQTPECTDDFKTATYSKWYDAVKTDQEAAYKAAVQYLTVCPNEPPDNAYANALKKYKDKVDKAKATSQVGSDFKAAIDKRNYKDIVRLGNQYVAVDPENSTAYLWIGLAGLNDASLVSDAVPAAKKAIELVEAGKSPEPYKTKEQALSAMNEVIARSMAKSAPADAIPYLIKAAKADPKNAAIFGELAQAYAEGPRAKLTKDYQAAQGPNGTETDASKLVLLNLNEVIDRQIDATARAAALATDAAVKKALMESLTDDYKFRKGSEAGLTEYVAGILSKPLPEPPTPITTLPATTPAATSAAPPAPSGAAPTTTATKPSASPSSGASSRPATTNGSQTSGTAKPAATPTPRPRSRNNHRG